MVSMLRSDLFQRIAGGFVAGAIIIVLVQPEGAVPFVDALKAVAGIA